MKTKRFWEKALIILWLIVFAVALVEIFADVMYYNLMLGNDEKLMASYEAKREKCELLISIKNDFIEEGKGINLQEIPDNIKYEIKNKKDGNTEFYYYIEQKDPSAPNAYNVRITFSNNFEIIDEVYGFELEEDFETYKQIQYRYDRIESYIYAVMFLFMLISSVTLITLLIFFIVRRNRNKKSHS